MKIDKALHMMKKTHPEIVGRWNCNLILLMKNHRRLQSRYENPRKMFKGQIMIPVRKGEEQELAQFRKTETDIKVGQIIITKLQTKNYKELNREEMPWRAQQDTWKEKRKNKMQRE